MSKLEFSKNVKETMIKKINALENLDYEEFMKKDEYFELVLCLAYLTLSKEKIIEKDMKNPNRLERLTKYVYTKDIDDVFSNGFSSEMPKIFNAKEYNNLWILDNIRDSIMHEVIEIDEERKCIIIKNNQYDRDLNAEIPFSWIIDYAKYDILSKKIKDKYTVKGFFYNEQKRDIHYFNTRKEIFSTILYTAHISGTQINIKEIENRIEELFKEYSSIKIDETKKEKYQKEVLEYNQLYSENYLISFLYARDMIKEIITKEYPNINIDIYISKRKDELAKNASRSLPSYYKHYDLMHKQFNDLVKPKGISLLNYISNIIEKLGTTEPPKTIDEKKNFINYILTGELTEYKELNDIYASYLKGVNILRIICLHTFGTSSLVINNNDTYKPYYESMTASDLNLTAYTRQRYIDFANQRKKLELDALEQDIKLFEKQSQLNKCRDIKGIIKLKKDITNIKNEKEKIQKQIDNLAETLQFKAHINYYNQDINREIEIKLILDEYYKHFYNAKTKEGKKKVKKVISKLLDTKIEEESKYIYGCIEEMSEVLTVIRNSISHIGRINVTTNDNVHIAIILNDYDNQNNHTGAVIGKYQSIIDLLSYPFEKTEIKTKKLTKPNN